MRKCRAKAQGYSGNDVTVQCVESVKRLKIRTESDEQSARRQGGQKRHKGYGIKLPENPAELVKQGRARKTLIGHTDGAERYKSVWTINVEAGFFVRRPSA
jgi:hypothetical protein